METLIEKNQLETYIESLSNEKLNGDFDEIFKKAPLPKSAYCGFGSLRGRFLQKFANKKYFIFVFGVVGLIFASSHAYYNGTITTMEKRFKIPSKNMGFISTGNDITGFILSTFIAYYGGRGHRPRYMAAGILAMVAYCLLNSAPHFVYGPGNDALALTEEYGGVKDEQQSKALQDVNNQKLICQTNSTSATKCTEDEGNMGAQLYLFAANLIAGIGQSLKHALGLSYLDDNIKKSKTPALISLSYFIRLLGPATGYALASFSLKMYIAPDLTPVITNKDPRWLGAWYMGWILIAGALAGFSVLMVLFPKELPRAAVRRRIAAEKERRELIINPNAKQSVKQEEEASLRDFAATFKRLVTNKIYVYNNLSTIFTIFGFMPFWIFSPKLIESLYRQSASASSLYTGSFALLSSAAGLLSAGFVITKFKPRTEYLTLWNVIIGVFSVLSILSFSILGCDESKNAVKINYDDFPSCNSDCNCDFVKYSPVCGADGVTYISGCHAGCTAVSSRNATKSYGDCSCIEAVVHHEFKQTAKGGTCPIDCNRQLTMFLLVMCFMKFIGATGRAGNFLIGMRCVEERDKTVAIGFGMSVVRIFAAVPSPIFFGYILDSACIAWGKTCSSKGNCWLYDGEALKYWFFYASAAAVAIGTFFDYCVHRSANNLKIFDDKDTPAGEVKEENEPKKIFCS